MPLERDIERRVRLLVETRYGGVMLKQTWRRGAPDRLIILPGGKVLFLELKRPGEKPKKIQKHWIAYLNDLGVPATWADSYREAAAVIEKLHSNTTTNDESEVEPTQA